MLIDLTPIANSVPKKPERETYIADDGLKHCKDCNQPLECEVDLSLDDKPDIRKMPIVCDCIKRERAEERERARIEQIEADRRQCFSGTRSLSQRTFANWENPNGKAKSLGENYVRNFKQMKREGRGLLLYGTVGTGKSCLAACIANQLVTDGYKARFTNFANLVAGIQSAGYGHGVEYIDSLSKYDLLILDDLGAERQSDFMLEQVYNIVDARTASGKPMIVTTNLTSSEMKDPNDVRYKRIYDRIFEHCFPFEMSGESLRLKKMRDGYKDMKALLLNGNAMEG